jgi:hypothetical protein
VRDALVGHACAQVRSFDGLAAHVRGRRRGDRPREARARGERRRVGPQEHGARVEPRVMDLGDRVEVRRAVCRGDAVPGTRVAAEGEAQDVVLVHPRVDRRAAPRAGQERLVGASAGAPHEHGRDPGAAGRRGGRALARGVGEEHARRRAPQDRRGLRLLRATVDGDDHAARGRHAEVHLEQLGGGGGDDRNPIAPRQAHGLQRDGEAARALGELLPRPAALAVDHAGAGGEHRGGALQERDRGDGRAVGERRNHGVGHTGSRLPRKAAMPSCASGDAALSAITGAVIA